jgi:hypothetical protein
VNVETVKVQECVVVSLFKLTPFMNVADGANGNETV